MKVNGRRTKYKVFRTDPIKKILDPNRNRTIDLIIIFNGVKM